MTAGTRRRSNRPAPSATRRVALLSAMVAALVSAAAVQGVSAASPSASAAPDASDSGEPAGMALQVWLDAPIPPESQVGERVDIGATVWDPVARELAATTGSYVRIHPATGSAQPEEAPSRSDWPGHLVASVRVPVGGAGRVEVGFEAEECRDDGGCQMIRVPFPTGGVGPPPEASRALLVVAAFRPPVEDLVADAPLDLALDLRPRADWDLGVLALPDRLVATASALQGGRVLATAELRRTAMLDTAYAGSITIPEPGDVVLRAAMFGGPDTVTIPTSTTRLHIEPGEVPTATSGTPSDAPPWPWIALVLAVAVAGALVIRKAFADL